MGLAVTIFLKALYVSIDFAAAYKNYFYFLPLGLLLSYLIIKKLAPVLEGNGTDKIISAIHKNDGKVNKKLIPLKIWAIIITIASGGSAGRVGPSSQVGAAVAAFLADLFRFDDKSRQKIVICGISAAFAAVFGTPIAGALFAVEVLYAGTLLYSVLLPSLVAGIISYEITKYFGIEFFNYDMAFAVPEFSARFFIIVIIAGVFFGLTTFILIETLNGFKTLSEKIKLKGEYKALMAGGIIIGLTLLFSTDYLGLGLKTINMSLQGYHIIWYAFLLKILFTALTLNFGGSGGIITPIFFIGAAAGAAFAAVFGLDTRIFAAIGIVSLLSGATNTPIASSVLAVELFGSAIVPYATVACVISYFMTGSTSVYKTQIVWVRKADLFQLKVGQELDKIELSSNPNELTITGAFNKILYKLGISRDKNKSGTKKD